MKKTASSKPTRSRAKATTSSGPAGSDAPSGSGQAQQQDWRTAVAAPTLPLGMRQKQVVDYLRQKETPATAAEIAAATGRDIAQEPDLAAALDANPKIQLDKESNTYSYLPDANVRNKQQLLDYIRRAGAPIASSEISDAYKTVFDDVAALKTEGLVLGMHSFDPEVGCEVLYAVDMKMAGLDCDDEVAALWQATEVPDDDDDVAAELKKVGLPAAPRTAPRKQRSANGEKKKKKRKATKLRAVTNAHLMHLLEGEAPAAIDNPIPE